MKMRWLIVAFLLTVFCFTFQSFSTAEIIKANPHFERLRQDAEKGVAEAQQTLGLLYLKRSELSSKTRQEIKVYGDPVAPDYQEAIKWFRKAADQGYARAQYDMGSVYYYGQGVEKDYAEAFKWYQQAADHGYVTAQRSVGILYVKGEGVAQDYTQARQWFQKAADQGNAQAQYDMGVMYYQGEGVTVDYAEAMKWFQKAAQQEDAPAQYYLGVMYFNGLSVGADYTQAFQWYRKAANQGYADAVYAVGYCYENGYGVSPQDKNEAMKWYRRAAKGGSKQAQEFLEKIGARTKVDQNGLYALQSAIDFNVLDSVTVDPATGQITLIGHRDTRYLGAAIPYLDHLAEFLENPSPEFSLDWTPESRPRVETLFNNFNSEEYVRGLAQQWAEIMDANGHPTGPGRWLLPLLGIKPTGSGRRMGDLGVEVREITQHLKRTYERLEILSVAPGSAAEGAGLVAGDVITNYANKALFTHNVRIWGEGTELMLQVQRGGQGPGADIVRVTLGGMDGDPWAELDKFDIVQKMLAAAGKNEAAWLIYSFAELQKIVLGSSHAGFNSAFSSLIALAGYNDTYWQNFAEYEAGRMSQDTVLDGAYRAIFGAIDSAFSFYDRPLSASFDNARRMGADSASAFDQTILVLNARIGPYLEEVMKTLLARHDEIQIPPEVMAQTLGVQVEVAPDYRGVNPNSQLARLLYSADTLGKSLINRPSLKEKIPNYESDFSFERNHPDKAGPWHASADYHLWFSIESLELAESKDGHTLQTRGAKIRFNIRQKGQNETDLPPVSGGYEELLTSLYDDFEREFEVLHELREAAKLSAVAAWLKSKKPDLKLPRSGRASWWGPEKAPGFLYLTWSPQERPGRLAMALSAMGGVSLKLVKAPKDIVGVADDNVVPVVDLSENPAWVSKISRMPGGTPVPQPVGWVTKGKKDGQDVTAVSFTPPKEEDSPQSVRVQPDTIDNAVLLWKTDDLEGAKKSLTDQLQKTQDPRAKAKLQMLLAQILHENGEDQEAIKNLNEATRLDPENPMLHLLIAKERYDSGKLAESEEALKTYLALDPKNEAAARLLTEIQADLRGQPREGETSPPGISTPESQGWSADLSGFAQPLKVSAASIDEAPEALKAGSELQDRHFGAYKLRGLEAPSQQAPLVTPEGLAQTKGWKKLEAEKEKLEESYHTAQSQLEEIRAKRTRGEGDPKDLDKLESRLQKQRVDLQKKQDALEKKMTNDIIQWNEKEEEKKP